MAPIAAPRMIPSPTRLSRQSSVRVWLTNFTPFLISGMRYAFEHKNGVEASDRVEGPAEVRFSNLTPPSLATEPPPAFGHTPLGLHASAIGPLTIVLMAAYFLTFSIIGNPSSPIAVVGSFLPPTAPLMMPLRAALTDVPIWQVATAVVIQVVSIYGLVRVGGRLYRGAVLKVGKKLSIREAWNVTAGDPA